MSQDPYEIAQREVERLWRDLVYHRHPGTHFAEQPWVPSMDVVVTEAEARVIVELAGVPREGVRVRLRGRTLEISGRRRAPEAAAGAHYHRAEIYFGDFRREMRFHIDGERACRPMEMRFLRRRRHHGIGADNVRKHGAGKPLGEFMSPFRISLDDAIAIPDCGRDDPIPRDKLRMQPARDSKTDNARNARMNRRV